MALQEFEAGLQAEGFETITTVNKESGYVMGDHSHPFDASALITAGSITLEVDGVVSTYKAGDVFRLVAGTLHAESAGPEGVSYWVGRRGAPA
jgi:quercetin dioxygenase-like cupin family protein